MLQIKNEKMDLIVVGAGVFGLSTCMYIAMHYPQLKFALIEQFKIGHEEGSSHSDIRIIRSTYFQEVYMKLCVQAIQRNWPQVEKHLGEKFIAQNSFISYTQTPQDFKKLQEVSKKSNGQIEQISLQQAKKRFPNVPTLKSNYPIFLDKKAGIIYAKKYNRAMISFLKTHQNLKIYQQHQVIQLKNDKNFVTVVLKKDKNVFGIQGNRVSLSCGRWIGQLIPKMKLIVSEVRQTIGFLQMKQPEKYTIGKYPSWVHYRQDGRQYFTLPNVFNYGLKFVLHNQDPSFINKFKNEDEYVKHCLSDLMEKNGRYFDGKISKLKKYEKCYYTVTKNQDFVIDWTDQHQNVLIVSPCSGHGFKFGPIIGNIIADLLVNKQSFHLFEQFKQEFKVQTHLKYLQKEKPHSKL